ncbi:hypothetical protein DCO56_11415 [Sphingobacterium athyrii]|uniref:Uncharacterized protein n=2 Tax=Sphingobacterium athyrii TaxID=2152717 RepID=A0A363NTC3_9SPHI|nr:hypothetical protein DCO56_11415 [Sphingobacterium athyrii]
MDQKRKNSMNFIVRNLLTLGAVILLFLSSFPIKMGIKTLMGLPQKVEQVAGAKGSFIGANHESCSSSILTDAITLEKSGLHSDNMLPVAILTAFILFIFCTFGSRDEICPRYRRIKIIAPLPIFLRDRKLII